MGSSESKQKPRKGTGGTKPTEPTLGEFLSDPVEKILMDDIKLRYSIAVASIRLDTPERVSCRDSE
jgi:hypothetical protein